MNTILNKKMMNLTYQPTGRCPIVENFCKNISVEKKTLIMHISRLILLLLSNISAFFSHSSRAHNENVSHYEGTRDFTFHFYSRSFFVCRWPYFCFLFSVNKSQQRETKRAATSRLQQQPAKKKERKKTYASRIVRHNIAFYRFSTCIHCVSLRFWLLCDDVVAVAVFFRCFSNSCC